jgi:hypothetical protein
MIKNEEYLEAVLVSYDTRLYKGIQRFVINACWDSQSGLWTTVPSDQCSAKVAVNAWKGVNDHDQERGVPGSSTGEPMPLKDEGLMTHGSTKA